VQASRGGLSIYVAAPDGITHISGLIFMTCLYRHAHAIFKWLVACDSASSIASTRSAMHDRSWPGCFRHEYCMYLYDTVTTTSEECAARLMLVSKSFRSLSLTAAYSGLRWLWGGFGPRGSFGVTATCGGLRRVLRRRSQMQHPTPVH